MGLWDKLKGELIDIIEWLDDSRDTIVWRFPRYENEIKMGAKLIVRESQAAVFVNEGRVADVFAPGTYTLTTQNMPILSTLKGWKYGFESPWKAEVYFVNTRQFTDMKWGTQNPVIVRDPEFGAVRLRAFGAFAMRVTDPAALLRELVGTDPQFRTEEVQEYLRQLVVGHLGSALATANVPFSPTTLVRLNTLVDSAMDSRCMRSRKGSSREYHILNSEVRGARKVLRPMNSGRWNELDVDGSPFNTRLLPMLKRSPLEATMENESTL